MKTYIYAFIVALVISYILTPFVERLAWKTGAVDIPKDERRVHTKPIPRIGGLAIYIAFIVTVLITMPVTDNIKGVIIGGTLITILGVLDDIYNLPAKIKLLGQVAAAGILVYFGIKVEWVTNPLGDMVYLGKLSIPITIFWIVGVTNTLNFIDGLDGLAAGIASIASFTLMLVALNEGLGPVVILTAALAGGAVGFLPFNFNPAKIFMGDTGAMFLGYVLAAISVMGAIKSATAIALAVPILALGLPIFDTAFAILRRAINGYPVMKADKDHLHHRLLAIGLTQRQTVLIMYSISAALGMSAIALSEMGLLQAGFILIVLITLLVIAGRQWGITSLRQSKQLDI
ncbi:putative undecaprenyl-phosphate N-acetylglucosaminyl 1-phosphate transferase [Koleobacter methoxysyntrophicus]|uniref:Putative undecaprenyl-phosphate N-acetylglucosaminyl 1-phosphate transferase n=1 Tax=Koleobacter methoxysyntrophicus TaxID=2751313 RepID=A0A8A0RL50_9FIRM|nr:MraY family glycosyltransferase [Koleobacter methoxysyntrophicus]QSQ08338.1 putative undecaprenyl-phosphate N-acetylglucosaminyl 1-phosphate transferase [Koleobacter methoxysyntrophicus]